MRRPTLRHENQRLHAILRFKERFNITFSSSLRKEVCRQIHCGEAKLVEKQSNQYKVYHLVIKNHHMCVIFNHFSHMVVTAYSVNRNEI